MQRILFPLRHMRMRPSVIRSSPYSTDGAAVDIRSRLLTELKGSMKARDTFSSTTIRSVLSEVYSADKSSPEQKIDSPAIFSLIRKATSRRVDSAAQFTQAARPDLAEKEQREADYLSQFLPPLLPEAELDSILMEILHEQGPQVDPRKATGRVLKAFYAKVDRSTVDPSLVKRRAEELLSK
ncbi:GatB/YqeY domain-containing protein [Auriscalpium vulgare]|uniref:GatB/YqeY domain-containing protein n=1 Tax=Auriscalpium vulgare TaxID=40419 RepID=A0ACB8RMY6_9AGAM|nr:GatB/YqeY domain-containing protein [Auriscalpium vulgare]